MDSGRYSGRPVPVLHLPEHGRHRHGSLPVRARYADMSNLRTIASRYFLCQKPKKKTSSEKNPFLHLLHVDNRDRGKPGHGVDTYIYRIRRFPGFSCRQTNTCERSIAGRSCDQSAMLRLQTLPRRQSDLHPEQ